MIRTRAAVWLTVKPCLETAGVGARLRKGERTHCGRWEAAGEQAGGAGMNGGEAALDWSRTGSELLTGTSGHKAHSKRTLDACWPEEKAPPACRSLIIWCAILCLPTPPPSQAETTVKVTPVSAMLLGCFLPPPLNVDRRHRLLCAVPHATANTHPMNLRYLTTSLHSAVYSFWVGQQRRPCFA